MELSMGKHLDFCIQSGMLCHIGIDIFNNIGDHYANHQVGKSDHITSLLRLGTKKYIDFQIKNLWKIVHWDSSNQECSFNKASFDQTGSI